MFNLFVIITFERSAEIIASEIETVTLETTTNHLSDLFSLFPFDILLFTFNLPFKGFRNFDPFVTTTADNST